MTVREQRIQLAESRILSGGREGDRGAGLDDVPAEPAERRAAGAFDAVRARPVRGCDDELVALEEPDRARVGVDQAWRLRDDLVEDGGRIELAREQSARACQLFGDRSTAALRVEDLGSSQRVARRVGEKPCDLELVFGERPLFAEEDDQLRLPDTARVVDGDRQEGRVAVRCRHSAPLGRQASVACERRDGDHAPVSCLSPRPLVRVDAAREEIGERRRQLLAADRLESLPGEDRHHCQVARQRLRCGQCHRLQRRPARESRSEQRRDPQQGTLDAASGRLRDVAVERPGLGASSVPSEREADEQPQHTRCRYRRLPHECGAERAGERLSRGDHWAVQIIESECGDRFGLLSFPASSVIAPCCKDGPDGPLSLRKTPSSLRATGRCKPRGAYLA